MSEQVLYRSPMMYSVLRDSSGATLIEVVVGRMAQSAVRVRLDASEAQAYADQGSAFTDALANKIMADPSFGGRSFDAPT